jgi:hypothetical protein
MLNAVCGEERSIVCDLSGTTRDAVDTTITLPDGQRLTLIDTAGIRKRARVADSKCVLLCCGFERCVWRMRHGFQGRPARHLHARTRVHAAALRMTPSLSETCYGFMQPVATTTAATAQPHRDGAEQLSVDRALQALSRAEVAVIVLDASEGVTQQVRVCVGVGAGVGACVCVGVGAVVCVCV